MSQSIYQHKTASEIISDLDIVNKMVERHYDIETEALKTDDVTDDSAVEYVANLLADYDNDELDFKWYEAEAHTIVDMIADDVIAEITDRDNDAMEYENERREAMKGQY